MYELAPSRDALRAWLTQAGIGPDPKVSREGIDQQRAYRGTCVRAPALSTL